MIDREIIFTKFLTEQKVVNCWKNSNRGELLKIMSLNIGKNNNRYVAFSAFHKNAMPYAKIESDQFEDRSADRNLSITPWKK